MKSRYVDWLFVLGSAAAAYELGGLLAMGATVAIIATAFAAVEDGHDE